MSVPSAAAHRRAATAAAEMTAHQRGIAAASAGQHDPSDRTWERVVALLTSRETLARKFAPVVADDPFDDIDERAETRNLRARRIGR